MTGTLINVTTVLVGSSAGLAIRSRLPDRFRGIALRLLGCVTLVLGAQMTFRKCNLLIVVTSLALGMLAGTLLRIQDRLERGARWLQQRFTRADQTSRVAEGFLDASLLFCVGPMTILGSIQDGLTGDYHLIAVKAMMDGVAAVALSSTLGWGVLLSAFTVLVIQGGITLGAQAASAIFTEAMIGQFTPVGGVLVICIGVSLTGIKKLPVADYLPAIFIAPALVRLLL